MLLQQPAQLWHILLVWLCLVLIVTELPHG